MLGQILDDARGSLGHELSQARIHGWRVTVYFGERSWPPGVGRVAQALCWCWL